MGTSKGPFAQTIFLGCSVTEASMNMAWGSEPSSCEVKLAYDYVDHSQSSNYNGLNTVIDNVYNTINNTTSSSALSAGTEAQKYLKPIIRFEKEKKDKDASEASLTPSRISNAGKKCWNAHKYGDDPYNWTSADPGFLGDTYSIIGVGCYFRFDDLNFAGIINRWTYDNGIYSITINGPGSLLRGAKLIINDYHGTISTLMPFNELALPYGDPGNAGAFNSNVANGNIPNLFNVYGWLQNQGFGFADISEYGISAIQIYNTIRVLIGGGTWTDFVDPITGFPTLTNANGKTESKFSPYGGIVGRSPSLLATSALVNTSSAILSKDSSSASLTKLGLMKTVPTSETGGSFYRCLYRVDISDVPKPDSNLYLPLSSSMALDEFIDFCCKGAGVDWNCSLIPESESSPYTACIKINIYDRSIQNPPNIMKNLVTNFTATDNVVSYDMGQEFKDQNVRKVVMGGKQERLFQVMSNTLSQFRNAKIYNPLDNTFMPVADQMVIDNLNNELGSRHNIVRTPLADAQRILGIPAVRFSPAGGAATAQKNVASANSYNVPFTSTTIPVGSYDTVTPKLSNISNPLSNVNIAGGAAYPIHFDLISPYFGSGSNGKPRKVFYDKKLRQLKINIPINDIANIFPTYSTGYGSYITIYENEIRAALGGIDSWFTYIFEPTKFGIWRPSARLIYTAISEQVGSVVANNLRLQGLGIMKNSGKEKNPYGNYHTGNPISPSQGVLFSNRIMPILQSFHAYIAQDLGKHYGKDYLVRVPNVQFSPGTDGVNRYDYEIIDSGWEETGNMLDDTMFIGSLNADLLAQENGKFGPILGWNNSAERDKSFPSVGNILVGTALNGPMGTALRHLAKMGNSNQWYYPLKTEGDYVVVPYNGTSYQRQLFDTNTFSFTSTAPTLTDSYGDSIPADYKYKIYQKASISDKSIIFVDDIGVQYVVISASSPVLIHDIDLLAKTIYTDIAVQLGQGEELPQYGPTLELRYAFNQFISNAVGASASALTALAIIDLALYSTKGYSTVSINNEQNMNIHPKAAVPCFAAIPVRYNRYLYGPWSTRPATIANDIFPESTNPLDLVNNIVGGVDIDINSQYVPWEYGGMDALDGAVLSLLDSNAEYQQVEEAGRITFAGVMLRNTNIGSRLLSNGPLCNSIQLTFGNDGIRTTYHFRTFSRKFGYFNQENAANIQRFSKQAIKTRFEMVANINEALTRAKSAAGGSGRSFSLSKAGSFSPVSVLVGTAYPFLHKDGVVNNFVSQCNFGPNWSKNPSLPNNVPSDPKGPRHITAVSLYDPGELDKTLWGEGDLYAQKAVMSLDGIFSPISLYPTSYHSTYSISKYRRTICPHCQNTNSYTFTEMNEASLITATGYPQIRDAKTTRTITPCPFCVEDSIIDTLKKKSAQPAELTPPYLIGSGTDRTIITDRAAGVQFQASIINNYTLNPVVLSATGSDFSCTAHKQLVDKCGHSIDVLAFGNVVPKADDALRAPLSNNTDKNFGYLEVNADTTGFGQNHRFFGLRGPLMLHSWGYDLEGYPVPNSSGEYKLASNGSFTIDSSGNPVGKNQVLQSDGSYSPPYKERSFMKGWAQQPASWPVGPIDLRWDSIGRVWTIGANYKPVWVVIETDLVGDTPSRGIVVESSYSNNPLPSGLRKMVFVKDNKGMFSAPRGAALYCKYDSVNGFYEPIYNRPLVTSGLIVGGSTATIYTAYTPSSVSADVVSSYNTTFDNPLNMTATANTLGLFIFLNGKWILQASAG